MKLFKLAFLFITSLIYSALAADIISDDPPICNTEAHVQQIYLRNVHDPTKYWACFQFNKPADSLTCPIDKGFDEISGKCIDWTMWRWMEPRNEIRVNRQGSTYTEGHDGRPACQTEYEVKQIYWRNNHDPAKYWKCEEKNKPGVQMTCPHGYAYNAPVEICIPLDRWEWSAPVDPPSLA